MAKKYFCEVCNNGYPTKKAADKCSAKYKENKHGFDYSTLTSERSIGNKVMVNKPYTDEKGDKYHYVGYIVLKQYKTLTELQLREQFGYERVHANFLSRRTMHNLVYTVSAHKDAKEGDEFFSDQLQTTRERVGRRRNIDRPF